MKIEEPAPENFLYTIWNDDNALRKPLCTIDGRRVEVIFKGTRNYDAGPDFKNATVVIDGEMHCGDIEVHPVASDWYNHGHHTDARYNNVVLHVVTMKTGPDVNTRRQDGELVPVLNLDHFLGKPSEQLAEEEQNSPPMPGDKRYCALREESDSRILQILELAGEERLSEKADRFTEERLRDSWNQIIYRGIAEALGYSKNQVPFRKLADQLPIEEVWKAAWSLPSEKAETAIQAYLFGTAGLLPTPDATLKAPFIEDAAEYVEQLQYFWNGFAYRRKIDSLTGVDWLFFRLRPQNFPTRRLAGLAAILLYFIGDGFLEGIKKLFDMYRRQPDRIRRELIKIFTVPANGYWENHFCFDESHESRAARLPAKLIGKDRAAEIVVNIILPCMLAYADEINDGKLLATCRAMYAQSTPLPENSITRKMKSLIFSSPSQQLIDTVRKQQGLIQLKKNVCLSVECRNCLDRYN